MSDCLNFSLGVKRGEIYEYRDPDGFTLFGRYVLVISAEAREHDSMISIIYLADKPNGRSDDVPVRVDGITFHAQCRLVSYCAKRRLGKFAGNADPVTMERIDVQVALALGLKAPERQDYEKLYHDAIALLDEGTKEASANDGKEDGDGKAEEAHSNSEEHIDGEEESDNGRKDSWFSRLRQRLFCI